MWQKAQDEGKILLYEEAGEKPTFVSDITLETDRYTMSNGGTTIPGVTFTEGDFVNFWSGLSKTNLTVTTNFEFTVTDDSGIPTKIDSGIELTGNNKGMAVLKEDLMPL